MNNNKFNTLAAAISQLQKKGFTHNFRVNEKGQLEEKKDEYYSPLDVELLEIHRFDGMTNPADDSILYAVKTRSGLKGTVVDSYGHDGSEITSEFMNKLAKERFGI